MEQGTSLAHVQPGVHHDPQVLFCQTAFQLVCPQHVLVPGVVPSQVQDFALALVELHGAPASPFLQPVKVPLDGRTALWYISHYSQFGVICKLAEGALYLIVQIINEDVNDESMRLISEGCRALLYLNLLYTDITNGTLRLLSSFPNLQYLSLAHCRKFTDKGLLYLGSGRGCHKLIYLDLSGCIQISVDGFRNIANGCSGIQDLLLNKMPTLTDRCIQALVKKCQQIMSVVFLDSPHLSDTTFKALAECKLVKVSIEGNNQITDLSFKLISKCCPYIRHIHMADCQKITDAGLKMISPLKHILVLNEADCISWRRERKYNEGFVGQDKDRERSLTNYRRRLLTLFPCSMGDSHGRQSSMNFSNVSPSHGLQFFTNCSSVGPFHRVQSFRNRLLQRGSLTGSQVLPANLLQRGLLSPWVHRSSPEPAPAWASHGVTASFGHPPAPAWGPPWAAVDICSTMDLPGLQWISTPPLTSMGCSGYLLHHGPPQAAVDICSTINLPGLQWISAPPWTSTGCSGYLLHR
ncbi:hypothetical protein QYF61_009492 [Mycteria americana]|uniref:F-box/LRR-repeat protein 15-like leucin rich repeat domain-containing protein n=1 Tax=Mycteria americana TaxID=33587 RepID=A0AAN7NTN8_MYCAM|nr:hypothetical protein QYF61_009492 [Mycteria americana]